MSLRAQRSLSRLLTRSAVALMATGGLALAAALPAGATNGEDDHDGDHGHRRAAMVYVESNDPVTNRLLAFRQMPDGSLSAAGAIDAGGAGTGAGLGSQGAVAATEDGRWVLVVNAGSDSVSLFETGRHGARLVDTEPSGGDLPVSIAVHGRTAYVLNAGMHNNIAGFRLSADGLNPISGSVQALSSEAAGGAQVGFSAGGGALVVTEKATNTIDTFDVHRSVAGPAQPHRSTGKTPFGFAIDGDNRVVVSNANGGAVGDSSLSSYQLEENGTLNAIDGPDTTHQTAACWVAISHDGRFAYTANAGSASISGYRIDDGGALALLDDDGVTATTGAGPVDLGLSRDGRFLTTLNGRDHSLSVHRVADDGSLVAVTTFGGLPATAAGVATG